LAIFLLLIIFLRYLSKKKNFVVRKVVCSIIGSRPDGLGSSKARYHLENFSFYVVGYGHDYGKLKPSVSHFCRVCKPRRQGNVY